MKDRYYLIIGGAFPASKDDIVNRKYRKNDFATAGIFYERKMLDGFLQNGFKTIFLSAPVVGDFPRSSKKIWLHKNDFNNEKHPNYVFSSYCLCYPFLHISKKIHLCLESKKIIKEINKSGKDTVIVVSEAHLPYLKTAVFIKNRIKNNCSIVLVMQDCPQLTFRNTVSRFYRFAKKNNVKKIYSLLQKNSFLYILLSKKMNEFLKLQNNRFKVIPGIQEFNIIEDTNISLTNFVYSGKLTTENGVELMIDAFLSLKIPNATLTICGNGPLYNYVKKCSQDYQNIKFLGYVEQTEIRKVYETATAFLAPRFSTNCFSSYSFPSKILDYLSTGKPVVTFKMDTYGDCLDDILIYPIKETKEDLANAMIYSMQYKCNNKYFDKLQMFFSKISKKAFADNVRKLVEENEDTSN